MSTEPILLTTQKQYILRRAARVAGAISRSGGLRIAKTAGWNKSGMNNMIGALMSNAIEELQQERHAQYRYEALLSKKFEFGGTEANKDICAICLDRKISSNTGMARPCMHRFACDECSVHFTSNGSMCPICRMAIEVMDSPNDSDSKVFTIDADVVLLAMGFLGPVKKGLLEELGVELDARGNVKTDEKTRMTSIPGVFAAGDMRRGQSLVVWAINEGRTAAEGVHQFLAAESRI